MKDVISTTKAREIDARWVEAGMQPDGLRIVGYRIAGNQYRTLLTVPGNDDAPCYEYYPHNPITGEIAPAYYHVSGVTLEEWYEAQDYAAARREAAELYEWATGR